VRADAGAPDLVAPDAGLVPDAGSAPEREARFSVGFACSALEPTLVVAALALWLGARRRRRPRG
jgi:hypothetical protein